MEYVKMYAILYHRSEDTEIIGVYATREAAIKTIAMCLAGGYNAAWNAYLDKLVACATEKVIAPEFGTFLVEYLDGQDHYCDYHIVPTYAHFGA